MIWQLSALLSLFVFSFLPYEPLFAQNTTDNNLTHYKISHFTTDDGLPGNALIALQQDLKGYLWFGGFEGLIRFEGTHFVTFDPTTTPELKSAQISSLQLDKTGTLWIGTGQGLLKYNDDKFTNLATSDFTFYIESMALDEPNQVLWLGTRNSGLFKYDIRQNTYTRVENNFSKDIITCIAPDPVGGIWISSEKNGVAYYNGNWKYYSKKEGLASNEITWLHFANEKLFICTILGLNILKDETISRVSELKESRVTKLKSDPQGNIWVLTTSGVHVLFTDGSWQTLSVQNGLAVNDIRDVCFDTDGSIWLATYRSGLNQLKKEKFVTLSGNEGLSVEAISTVSQLSESKFIAGTTDGKIFTIENRKAKLLPIHSSINKPICEILKDTHGNLWFATYDGLLLITPDGRERIFTEDDGLPTRQLRSILQDKNQDYWIGSRTSGVIKMELKNSSEKPIFTKPFHEQLIKCNSTFVISMTTDADGNLLIAASAGVIVKIAPDGTTHPYKITSGQSTEVTFTAHTDNNGTIWVAGTRGLSRIKNDTVTNFSRAEGIPHETIYDVVEDGLGYFWLSTVRGIIKVKKSELERYIKNKNTTIHWRMFDKNDDLIKSECTGASRILKDTHGHLWFPMLQGLVKVNPEDIQVESKAPDIVIDSFTVDDVPVDLSKEINLEPGSKRFVISYHAISLKYQKAIRYTYRIENYDASWIDPGAETEAVYTSLPPGHHTFKVTACNKDEICNSTGASISFTVQPYFYQRIWFYFLCGNAIVLAGLLYTRIRTRTIRQRALELQGQVNERTRELASQRDELVVLNEELKSSQEEVMAQRDILSEKNREIEQMNTNLERTVADRTLELEEQNKKLAEYAFINAHQLRAPLASILGIIHLLKIETDPESQKKLLDLLLISSNDLDVVIRSINKMLEEGDTRLKDDGTS